MSRIDEIINMLDDDDSLSLGQSPWAKDIDSEKFEIRQVDWSKLFPQKKPTDTSPDYDWEAYGDEWDINEDLPAEIFEGASDIEISSPEDWDVCAWYQPIHFHGYDWGIFIKEECLKRLASKIYIETGIVAASLNFRQRKLLAKGLLRTAFSIFYHHELYHHKTECLGLRLHAVQKRSSYLPYFSNVYKAAAGTDLQIEEALANAFMYRDIEELSWVSSSLAKAGRSYLARSFPKNPPGYRLASNYLTDKKFESGQHQFFSQVIDGASVPAHNYRYWGMAPRINHSFLNIKSDIWTVVPQGSKSVIPITATPLRTCSSDDIVKVCGKHGYRVTPGGKGSHIKLKKSGSPTLIVPGNRDNVSPGVTKNILASLGYKINQLPELL
jgi:predicted RNA binding protein YcfA (HicA-like mRNA interferase family)